MFDFKQSVEATVNRKRLWESTNYCYILTYCVTHCSSIPEHSMESSNPRWFKAFANRPNSSEFFTSLTLMIGRRFCSICDSLLEHFVSTTSDDDELLLHPAASCSHKGLKSFSVLSGCCNSSAPDASWSGDSRINIHWCKWKSWISKSTARSTTFNIERKTRSVSVETEALNGGADENALMSSVRITGQIEASETGDIRSNRTRRKRNA